MSSLFPASAAGPREWADRFGIWTSALCVVHCLLMPVLLSFSAVLAHFLPAEESVHRSLALLVASFGALALIVGFRKHRRALVLLMMLIGLGLHSRSSMVWRQASIPCDGSGGSRSAVVGS